jgi:outer membrane protein OmpA-like peptidoglycan-associated protein
MNRTFIIILLAISMVAINSAIAATFLSPKWGYGIDVGAARGDNAGGKELWEPLARGHIQTRIWPQLSTQIGVSYSVLHARDLYSTQTLEADARLIFSPVRALRTFPYIFLGFGVTKDLSKSGTNFLPVVPAGIGIETPVGNDLLFQLKGGYNLVLSDDLDGRVRSDNNLNTLTNKKHDSYYVLTIGFVFGRMHSVSAYNTGVTSAPKEPYDTDRDGLSDAAEKEYGANPKKPDTDGDGLNDSDEVKKYHSDPLKKDTDGDGLNDNDEVKKYHSDPLKADTDSDGLSDFDEVSTYHTDPLLVDSDDGGMVDGAEIKAGKNPLDPKDDLFDLSKGKKVILHGINFDTNKFKVLPESEWILEKARVSMVAHPDATIVISGHTDSVGSDEDNRTLSQKRAQAVKDWLVDKGISADRMKVVGKGELEPMATNETEDGKAQNRRIEFLVE